MERRLLVYSVVRLGHLRHHDSRAVQREGRGRGVRRRSPHDVFLFVGYGLSKAGVIVNAGLLVWGVVIGFTPIILAALACPFFKPELLRPISARPASAEPLAAVPIAPAG
jgi:hypothetical protein